MDPRVGSHPDQLRRLAKSYRLKVREYNKMSLAQLRQELRWRHPVMLSIQAYGLEPQGKRRRKVIETLTISDEARQAVLGGNALRLLRLKR